SWLVLTLPAWMVAVMLLSARFSGSNRIVASKSSNLPGTLVKKWRISKLTELCERSTLHSVERSCVNARDAATSTKTDKRENSLVEGFIIGIIFLLILSMSQYQKVHI